MKIVMINGRKGSGKDTLADLCVCELIKKGVKVGKIPNAEYVKEIATKMYNWNGIKNTRGRQLLIDITNTGYSYSPNFFEEITYQKAVKQKLDVLIIPDWRYLSTYEYLSKMVGDENIVCFRVLRKDHTKDNETLDNDVSEVGLDKFVFDCIVDNNGNVHTLEQRVESLLKFTQVI